MAQGQWAYPRVCGGILTRAALEASGWLKRYVQGVLRVTATGDDSGEQEV